MRTPPIIGLILLCTTPAWALPERETVRGLSTAVVVIPEATEPTEEPDPRNIGLFRAICYVDVQDGGTIARRFAIHIPDRDQLLFARRAARFMALLWGMANQRFGRSCARLRDGIVHVWLTRAGEPGGEQHDRNLYIYDLFSDRTGIEWARELAHEYGHYLLPAPSGYTSPESWANGVLGERLFLKWLTEDVSAERIAVKEVPYVKPADLADYSAKQVNPLVERLRKAGPNGALLSQLDKRAMDEFTGLILYIDSVYGSRTLMDMLDYLPKEGGRVRAAGFLDAFLTWAGRSSGFATRIASPGAMVYLPGGKYRVRSEIDGPPLLGAGKGVDLTRDGDAWTVNLASPGWRMARGPGLIRWDRFVPVSRRIPKT